MSIATKVSRMTSQGGMVGRVPMGDPGLWGAIKGAVGTVARGAVGFAVGGPAGAIGAVAPGLLGGGGGPQLPALPPELQLPRPGVMGAVQRFLPGGQTGMIEASGIPPKGYRLNKTGYFLKSTGEYVAPRTRWVKIRRRNSLNPRALSRAISRIDGAKKASKTLSRVTIRKKTC